MIRHRGRRFLWLLAAVSALLGCSAGTRVPEDSFYRLEIPSPTVQPVQRPLPGVLLVQVDAAAPVYRDRSFLYSDDDSPNRLQRHHYRHWVDSPPSLLEQALVRYLTAAGAASLVVGPDDRIDARYRLRFRLERFEHVRDHANGTVVIEASLLLTERAVDLPLRQERLRAETPVTGRDFDQVVAAYQKSVESLYTQVQSVLALPD